ncbi:MAG: hypothetical protein IJQ89_10485 [Bacteroidales bacterium]|nr:hypothetical protein [Bacteroidales bacterium]
MKREEMETLSETIDLRYILGIMNSKYANILLVNQRRGDFHIYADHLRNIPIPQQNDNKLVECVNKMLTLNSDLQQKRSRFLRRLQENMPGIKINGALETSDNLDFAGFVAELKKQKIKLTLVQQDEWEEYFNQYKTECQSLKTQIATTDKEIDKKVYALYGLTEDEVKVVEGK